MFKLFNFAVTFWVHGSNPHFELFILKENVIKKLLVLYNVTYIKKKQY